MYTCTRGGEPGGVETPGHRAGQGMGGIFGGAQIYIPLA